MRDDGVVMPVPVVVVTQFVFALLAYGLVAKWYVAPLLVGKPLDRALPPLLLPHLFRPVSLWLLAPGVIVRDTIPTGFATGTAYGDLVAVVLAAIAVFLVHARHRGAVVAAWIFNVWGTADALRNCAVGIAHAAPEHMGAMAFVPSYCVPLLLVSHALVFKVLLEHRRNARRGEAR